MLVNNLLEFEKKIVLEEKIQQLIVEKFQEEPFQDYFFIELKIFGNKVEVFVDSDSGVTIEACAKLNRYLQSHIDEAGWLGEKYTLDVSSSGVGRPLKLLRQYQKNIGRTLAVKLIDGEKKKGILTKVDEDKITLEHKERVKEGKKKKTVVIESEISIEQIEEAKIKITF